jgi:hypothetical protein
MPLIRRLIGPFSSRSIVIPSSDPIEERMQGLDALLALEQIGRDAEALVSLEAIAHGDSGSGARPRAINWPLLQLALPPGQDLAHRPMKGPKSPRSSAEDSHV